jgi:protein SSD1
LDALVMNATEAEEQKMEEEKQAKGHGKGGKGHGGEKHHASEKKSDHAQSQDDFSSERIRPNPSSALLAKLSSASPDPAFQHRGIVLGILTPKFPTLRCPGLLKPFSPTLALFCPLDKKTPFALVAQRTWPEGWTKVYREYLRAEEERKKEKKAALRERKTKGNFPESGENSSEIVAQAEQEQAPEEEEVEVDAMTAAASPDSLVLDPHIYIGSYLTWSAQDRQPFATIEQTLGLSGDIQTETEALLIANGVDYDFDGKFEQNVLDEVSGYSTPGQSWSIPSAEIAKRRDFRDQTQWRIVSIDPTTARDLDDAIHVRRIDDDVVEIGVHIADVSHFVHDGSALDAAAKHRATTIYLVQKAIPMLPPILCEQLCSLNPNVDRLAYSCVFQMSTSTGKLLRERGVWYGKSVIRTCCRLNYEAAQLLMEFDRSKIPSGRELQESDFAGTDLAKYMAKDHAYRPVEACSFQQLLDDMQLLHRVSMRRRADRFEVGSLTLSNVKLQFRLDSDKNPTGFVTYPIYDSNRVVEECMLLANLLVAEQCVKFCRSIALLRRHPPPNEQSMRKVNQACQELGYDIDATTAGSLQRSLDQHQGRFVGRKHGVNDATIEDGTIPLRQVLEPLCTKPMQLAKYFCTGTLDDPKEWAHFALHMAAYTHFTSPIRRYADVIVHRVLSYSLEVEAWLQSGSAPGKKPRAPQCLAQELVADIAETCNTRKANAKKAQEQSSKIYLCDFLLRHHSESPLTSSAIIIDMFCVQGNADPSFDILAPSLGIEKKIHL